MLMSVQLQQRTIVIGTPCAPTLMAPISVAVLEDLPGMVKHVQVSE